MCETQKPMQLKRYYAKQLQRLTRLVINLQTLSTSMKITMRVSRFGINSLNVTTGKASVRIYQNPVTNDYYVMVRNGDEFNASRRNIIRTAKCEWL